MDTIEIEVTKISPQDRSVTFNYKDEEKTSQVIEPCKVEFVKIGKGNACFNGDDISYFRSNEPFKRADEFKPKKNAWYGQVKLISGRSLMEFQTIYNEFSEEHWVTASNHFNKEDGKYDFLIFWNKMRTY